MKKEFNFEFIEELPFDKRGKYNELFTQFIESDQKIMRFNCKSVEVARKLANAAAAFRRSRNLDFTIYKRINEVYLVRS
ncbi:MAG: hypothetical protein IJF87_05955 [Erysipelotrichaceae bacterium]|nr:hypothetical protein [Erysipelotrichaceae bacterium]